MDIAFSRGVERFVAENRNAISYAQHAKRNYAVKSLPIGPDRSSAVLANASTVAAGSYPLARHLYLILGYPSPSEVPQPLLKFADRLLSREGQRAVAATGSFALTASEIRASRQRLGL
jgi:phosphate transport system substrate-binding protein